MSGPRYERPKTFQRYIYIGAVDACDIFYDPEETATAYDFYIQWCSDGRADALVWDDRDPHWNRIQEACGPEVKQRVFDFVKAWLAMKEAYHVD